MDDAALVRDLGAGGSEQPCASWVMGVPSFSWMQSHIPWWEGEVRRGVRITPPCYL